VHRGTCTAWGILCTLRNMQGLIALNHKCYWWPNRCVTAPYITLERPELRSLRLTQLSMRCCITRVMAGSGRDFTT
jgi:hypothetical protein